MLEKLTDKDWDFLCGMSPEEKARLDASIIQEQERRKGLLSVHELGEILNLGRDGINALPLRFVRPFRQTPRGLRQVKSVYKGRLIEFLAALNPAFSNYDPAEGPLLIPAQAVERFGDDLPEFVQITPRTRRYRSVHQELDLAAAIMEGPK